MRPPPSIPLPFVSLRLTLPPRPSPSLPLPPSPASPARPAFQVKRVKAYLTINGGSTEGALEKKDLLGRAAALIQSPASLPGIVERLLESVPASSPPDACLIFVTRAWEEETTGGLPRLMDLFNAALPSSTVTVCGVAEGIIGTDQRGAGVPVEVESRPAFSVALIRLPAAHFSIAHVPASVADGPHSSPPGAVVGAIGLPAAGVAVGAAGAAGAAGAGAGGLSEEKAGGAPPPPQQQQQQQQARASGTDAHVAEGTSSTAATIVMPPRVYMVMGNEQRSLDLAIRLCAAHKETYFAPPPGTNSGATGADADADTDADGGGDGGGDDQSSASVTDSPTARQARIAPISGGALNMLAVRAPRVEDSFQGGALTGAVVLCISGQGAAAAPAVSRGATPLGSMIYRVGATEAFE